MNDRVDMSRFVEAKSDQLNADDLIGITRTITITRVTGNDGDQPVSIFFNGDNGKPFKPCKTMRRILMAVWGRYANDYVGKSMTLYRDDKVTFGVLETGGIRISHMSHIDKETVVVVMKTKGKKAGIKILPLKMEEQSEAKPDPAERFANGYMNRLEAIQSADELEEYVASKASEIERLAGKRADLAKQCGVMLDRRRSQLKEGRSDEQHGDQHDGTGNAPDDDDLNY
jgi:hypothetical protein